MMRAQIIGVKYRWFVGLDCIERLRAPNGHTNNTPVILLPVYKATLFMRHAKWGTCTAKKHLRAPLAPASCSGQAVSPKSTGKAAGVRKCTTMPFISQEMMMMITFWLKLDDIISMAHIFATQQNGRHVMMDTPGIRRGQFQRFTILPTVLSCFSPLPGLMITVIGNAIKDGLF